jgi:hypothetical protein
MQLLRVKFSEIFEKCTHKYFFEKRTQSYQVLKTYFDQEKAPLFVTQKYSTSLSSILLWAKNNDNITMMDTKACYVTNFVVLFKVLFNSTSNSTSNSAKTSAKNMIFFVEVSALLEVLFEVLFFSFITKEHQHQGTPTPINPSINIDCSRLVSPNTDKLPKFVPALLSSYAALPALAVLATMSFLPRSSSTLSPWPLLPLLPLSPSSPSLPLSP